jgi:spoIIIJ-associated protein
MSEYQEFTGKTVEEALRDARQSFGVGMDDLDFEILTPGSRGVLGMGAEPARIIAAPRSALGGAAPRREAAAATPLPPVERPPREGGFERDRGDRFGRDRDRGGRDRDRGGRDRGERRFGDRPAYGASGSAPVAGTGDASAATSERPSYGDRPRFDDRRGPSDRPPRDRERGDRGDRPERTDRAREGSRTTALTETEQDQIRSSRASLTTEREEIQAAEASPEALAAGRDILDELLKHMGIAAAVTVETGETAKLNVTGEQSEKDALGALIGRKGERLSALQHLVNLMLSRKMGEWTRVLVDVEDYRGRRERQLRDIAMRAAERVNETGKMLQLEPMPALERRWIHLALRNHPQVVTQSIGEEPQRRVVILRREATA